MPSYRCPDQVLPPNGALVDAPPVIINGVPGRLRMSERRGPYDPLADCDIDQRQRGRAPREGNRRCPQCKRDNDFTVTN